MSLILDALNKAENERKQQQQVLPGIATAHDNFAPSTGKPRIKASWVFAAMAVFILLLIAVYYWGRTSQEPRSSSLPPLAQQTTAPGSAQRATSEFQASNNLETIGAAKSPNATDTGQRAALKPSSPAQQLIAQQYGNAEAAKQRGKQDDIGNLYETSDATPPPPADDRSPAQIAAGHQEVLRQLRVPPSADKNSISYYSHIGSVRELTYAMQQNIPTLMYQKHDYRQGGDSSVTINGKTARKGSKIAEDVTVVDILADGIVLKYRSKTFKMAAYSSWVNM